MAFSIHYVTDEYTVYLGDVRTSNLSFAVWLIDDFTGEQAIGHIRVMIKETSIEASKNLSGYYIFTGLAVGQYPVSIFSDLYSFKETTLIDTTKIKFSDVLLDFDTNGPVSGATSIKLTDVSRLQKNDVVEFRNLSSEVERKNLTDVKDSTRTVSWGEELEHNFSAASSTILAFQNPVVTVHLNPLPSYPFPNNATLVRGRVESISGESVTGLRVRVKEKDIENLTDSRGEFVLYFKNVKKTEQVILIINEETDEHSITVEEGKTVSAKEILIQ